MEMRHNILFNFAASYSTGGYKRLYEYAKWFDENGGAWFIIHRHCSDLILKFPNLCFFVVKQSRIGRLYKDCGYLEPIVGEIGTPDLYYSYGVPMYSKVGLVNWFHLSNVLPLGTKGVPLSASVRIKSRILGQRIRDGLSQADVISAESKSSLARLGAGWSEKLFLSVNGSDDEIGEPKMSQGATTEEIAMVVGTATYKKLEDSFRIFESLRENRPALKLIIFGSIRWIPKSIRRSPNVILRGLAPRSDVISSLRRARYYISTTCIENSYNAAAEGVFLADESYVSDIDPHRELLMNEPHVEVLVPGVASVVLKVRRDKLSGVNLRTWSTIIEEMLARFRTKLNELSAIG